MDSASILAIIILVIAILILIYYYLQSTNNPVYQNIHAQAAGLSTRVAQEEYVSNISDKVNDFGDKVKSSMQSDDENHVSKTDMVTKKIDQFFNEQSEQIIEDWNLVTKDDFNGLTERFKSLNDDFSTYREDNDKRVLTLEQRVDQIDKELEKIK